MDGHKPEMIKDPEKQRFLGLSISIFDKTELEDYLTNVVKYNNTKVLYGYSLWTISVLNKIPEIYNYAEQADFFVTDGRPFYLLAKWHGVPMKIDLSIPGLVFFVLQVADKFGWSVFLLGASEEMNRKAQENLQLKYPGVKKVDGRNGFFSMAHTESILEEVNKMEPNIILVGMPSPTKEKIAIELKTNAKANIIIPCGGMIDVLAGKTKATPRFIKKLGLASFYRLIQEPKRLFKRTFRMYLFLTFRFMPVYFYKTFLTKDRDFSVFEYYTGKK